MLNDLTVSFSGGFAVAAIAILLCAVCVLVRDAFRRRNHVLILTENERAILEKVLKIDIHYRERYLKKFEVKPVLLANALRDLKSVHRRLIELNPNPRSMK